jgi:hypothetical protein
MKIHLLPPTIVAFALLSINVSATVHYVDPNCTNPVSPYTNWSSAATTIQDAVDAASTGDQILVTNGIYQIGGRTVNGEGLPNRIAVIKPVTIQSVNGPLMTVIQGGGGVSYSAVRCAYLTNGARLNGFTLTAGGTWPLSGGVARSEWMAGGAWCASASAVLSNCVITGNAASYRAGGVKGGTLDGCMVVSNAGGFFGGGLDGCVANDSSLIANVAAVYGGGGSEGGGAHSSTLNNCQIIGNSSDWEGGGAFGCTLTRCALNGNSSGYLGGGTYGGTANECTFLTNSAGVGGGACGSTLNNCILTGNSASAAGGGAFECGLNNSALTGNSAGTGGGAYGSGLNNCTLTGNSAILAGGTYAGSLNNSILYYNTALSSPNYAGDPLYGISLNYCCTTPLPGGTGNIDAEPRLASPSRLSVTSPCRGAGSAAYASGTDIDGDAWGNPPSIGCDEPVSAPTGSLSVAILAANTTVAPGFDTGFTGLIDGPASTSGWEFGDGTVVSNLPYASHRWAGTGDYAVVLRAYNASNPGGVSATVTVHVVETPVHYVASGSTNPVPPYSSWSTAAANIQDAIDSATVPGALVLVGDGLYVTGGRIVHGSLTNRVAVTKPVIVQSLHGPELTVIEGYQAPGTTNDDSAVRCVYLADGAKLMGFTLTNGATRGSGDALLEQSGGGVFCESARGVVSNCVLTANSAAAAGGAAQGGSLNNCILTGNSALTGGGANSSTLRNSVLTANSAQTGGGASGSSLYNCTLTGNFAAAGGGVSGCVLGNCITYYNLTPGPAGANYSSSTLNFCSTTPLPDTGTGNLTAEPLLASDSHLSAGSPCRGAGNATDAGGTDIDAEAWANPPSIGCDEYHAGAATGPLTVAIRATYTNVAASFAVKFTALIQGRVSVSRWAYGDGTVMSNRPYTSHSWAAPGDYPVVLSAYNESNPGGISATVTVHVVSVPVHYVDLNSTNPVPPFASWTTAATNIQDAMAAVSIPGAKVLVNDGVYQIGGQLVSGTVTNRVAVTNPAGLESLNGPMVTVIDGGGVVRCVYLVGSASISGFTLTNGTADSGGGAWCESIAAVVSNCVFTGNSAGTGGGFFGGTANNCVLTGNGAEDGAGAAGAILNGCALNGNSANYGGGAFECVLNNCAVQFNFTSGNGSGAYGGMLNGCLVSSNAAVEGLTLAFNTANHTTLVGNANGVCACILNNCILVDGTFNYGNNIFNYCCTTPLPDQGMGNFTNAPLFVDEAGGNFRLQSNSPCINAGNNAYITATNDLDGNPRIVGGTVDVGAYECQAPARLAYYVWLQNYGLSTYASAAYVDTDGDGLNNWQEYLADTSPLDANDFLHIISFTRSGTFNTLWWTSKSTRLYRVERRATFDDASPWKTCIAIDVPGWNYVGFDDNGSQYFYRIEAVWP